MAASAQKPRASISACAALLLLLMTACATPVERARISPSEPPTPAEIEAGADLRDASCSPAFSWLYPGIGQICYGALAEGVTLASLATVELSASVVLAASGHVDAASYPLAMLQNTWIYGVTDGYIHQALARRRPYTPPEGLFDLMGAPFNVEVLRQPEVWVGLPLMVGSAVALSLLTEDLEFDALRLRPGAALTGGDVAEGALAGAAGVALFEHVAIGEETLFRGAIQSGMARAWGPWPAWGAGSLIFGAAHIPNALAFESERNQLRYLFVSVPFITVVGSYLGLTYHYNDYSLSVPTALHFWYDLALFVGDLASTGGRAGSLSWTLRF